MLLTSLSVITVPEIQSTAVLVLCTTEELVLFNACHSGTDIDDRHPDAPLCSTVIQAEKKCTSGIPHAGFGVISTTRTADASCYKNPGEDEHCYLPLIYTELTYPLSNCLNFSTFSQFSRSGVTCLYYTKGVLSVLQQKLFLQGKFPQPDNNRQSSLQKYESYKEFQLTPN